MRWRRGISCIFSRSRTGRDRCARLSRRRAPASALPLAPARLDTAILFADAPVCAPFRAQTPAGALERALPRERPRWPRLRARRRCVAAPAANAAAAVARLALAEAARSAAFECGK